MRRKRERRQEACRAMALGVALAAGAGLGRFSWGDVTTTGSASQLLQVTASQWQDSDPAAVTFYVGLNSTGALFVTGIATLTTPIPLGKNYPSLSIGSAAGVQGGVEVTGPYASVSAPGLIETGEFGTGTLLVTEGGQVGSTDFAAGGQVGSTGYVGVDGEGSVINVSDNFLIGNLGNGTLDVDNEGSINTAYGVIGGDGTGNATFSNGSLLTCTQSLIVAGANFGNLTLETGSVLESPTITLGVKPTNGEYRGTPGGQMVIDGSTVTATTALQIANNYYSFDVVTAKNGSTITAGEVDVGNGGTGTLVLGGDFTGRFGTPDDSGKITTLTASTINIGGGQFDAGGIQSGMYVINGSQVNSDTAAIGGVDGFGYVGGVTEAGERSTWNAGNLTIETGDLGGGLSVAAGGLVTSDLTIIDDGVAVVDGVSGSTPSTWRVTGPLYVGSVTNPQPYTLQVTGGAHLETADVVFGDFNYSAGGDGATLIDGEGTTWTAGNVTVGNGFYHALTISGGAVVTTASFTIAYYSPADVMVTDPGSVLDTQGELLTVGVYQPANLTIQNVATLKTGDADIGSGNGSDGVVTLTDIGTTWTAGNVTVGDKGCGTLAVGGDATLNAASLHIGRNAASEGSPGQGDGTVEVDGGSVLGSSTLQVSGDLFVGEWGIGEMDISEGGEVTSNTGFVGTNGGSEGTLAVSGSGSHWGVTNYLTIGTYGTGNAEVSLGASVDAGNILVGENAGAMGTLSVTGAEVNSETTFDVGKGGNGTLTVTENSTVTADSLTVGGLQTGVGVATFDGKGTVGEFDTLIEVGDFGTGTLGMTGLAKVSVPTLVVGVETGSEGTVTVDGFEGAGNGTEGGQTTLAIEGDLTVGAAGTGSLSITGGGLVTSANGYVGDSDVKGNGTVKATGQHALWGIGGNLRIGGNGTGSVDVEDGATVTAMSLEMGRVNNGSGAEAPDGTLTIVGGTVTISGAAMIGDAGVAAVTSNGTLVTGNVVLGNVSTGTGSATIGGGTWTLGTLTIGEAGNGTVTVSDGAVNSSAVVLGDAAGSQGTLGVGSAGGTPLMIANGTLTVGNGGAGNVTISSGDLTVNAATLGVSATASGVVNVTSGGELQVAGKLLIGSAGSGDVEVTTSGRVIAQSVVIGGGTGAAQYNMNGTGCTLAVIGSITIGTAGANGTFSEMNGGNVSAQTTNVGASSLTASGVGVGTLTVSTGTFKAGKLTVASGSTVTIQQGGTISGSGATIGSGHFLSAQVTITGPTSTLDMGTGNISVGGLGAADLEVDGGVVNCSTLTVDVAGKLQGDGGTINGNVVNKGGTVHPGDSPGTLTLSGDFEQDDGVLDVDFTGTAAAQRDLLSVGGNATLTGGVILFSFLEGYVPQVGDVLPFLSAATMPSVSGVTFDFVGAPAGVSFSVVTAGDTEELVVAPATPEPGTALLVGMGVIGLVVRRRSR